MDQMMLNKKHGMIQVETCAEKVVNSSTKQENEAAMDMVYWYTDGFLLFDHFDRLIKYKSKLFLFCLYLLDLAPLGAAAPPLCISGSIVSKVTDPQTMKNSSLLFF